jgi:hypothetical protein
LLKLTERACGAAEPHEVGRRRLRRGRQKPPQRPRAVRAAAQVELQQAKLKGRVAPRVSGRWRHEQHFRLGVATSLDIGARAQDEGARVGQGPEKRINLVEAAEIERTGRRIDRRRICSRAGLAGRTCT